MSEDLYRLLLVDDDRIFRMGMRFWIDQCADLELVAEADSTAAALKVLQDLRGDAPNSAIADMVNLIILDLGIGQTLVRGDRSAGLENSIDSGSINSGDLENSEDRENVEGLQLCQQLKSLYPNLPILLLCRPLRPELIARAWRSGIKGYCPKGIADKDLLSAIRQVATGGTYGGDRSGDISTNLLDDPSSNRSRETIRVTALIRYHFYQSGLRNIEQALKTAKSDLERNGGSEKFGDRLSQIFIEGQIRELQAARWLIGRIWNTKQFPESTTLSNSQTSLSSSQIDQELTIKVVQPLVNQENESGANILAVQTSLWNRTVEKLQTDLTNLSRIPLEIDILKDEKKRELLYITLRQVEQSLADLRFSQIQPTQLQERIPAILRDIWQTTVIGFFGKHYTIDFYGSAIEKRQDLAINNLNIVDYLLNDMEIVEAEFLNKIPQVENLFSHLLFATELVINNSSAALGTVEAMQRAEQILDHLIIHIANGVIQPLLNRFANVEQIKQTFYRYNLLSTREIERFRNDLSWKYRLENYITNPQLIFESRYILFVLANPGIKRISIYAPRNQELQQLEGVQLAVTLALELQDAIAPRLKSAISLLGSGFVYILTNVIGRGIGLIGRGVMQGIGNAWQESRPKR